MTARAQEHPRDGDKVRHHPPGERARGFHHPFSFPSDNGGGDRAARGVTGEDGFGRQAAKTTPCPCLSPATLSGTFRRTREAARPLRRMGRRANRATRTQARRGAAEEMGR